MKKILVICLLLAAFATQSCTVFGGPESGHDSNVRFKQPKEKHVKLRDTGCPTNQHMIGF